MKNKKENIITDFSFIIMMLLMLVSTLFIMIQSESPMLNIIMLNIVFFIAIITYFTTLTFGLVIATSIVFIFLTVTLCLSVLRGSKPNGIVYFWSILLPAFTVSVGIFCERTIALQRKNKELSDRLEQLITVDEETGLRNQKAFSNDALAYINMSKRYGHHLILCAISIRHEQAIRKIIGKEAMNRLVNEISDRIESSIRQEDLAYLIDRETAVWAILCITNDTEGIKRVDQKIKAEVSQIEVKQSGKIKRINIEICIGQASCERCNYSPVEFLMAAKNQMTYDV